MTAAVMMKLKAKAAMMNECDLHKCAFWAIFLVWYEFELIAYLIHSFENIDQLHRVPQFACQSVHSYARALTVNTIARGICNWKMCDHYATLLAFGVLPRKYWHFLHEKRLGRAIDHFKSEGKEINFDLKIIISP
jgi:hypothetical protein